MAVASTPRHATFRRAHLPALVVAPLALLVMAVLARGAMQPDVAGIAQPMPRSITSLAIASALEPRTRVADSVVASSAQPMPVLDTAPAVAAPEASDPIAPVDAASLASPAPQTAVAAPEVRTAVVPGGDAAPAAPASAVTASAAAPAIVTSAPLAVVAPPTPVPALAISALVPPPAAPTLNGREQRFLDALNAHRGAAGLQPLLANSTLTQAARSRSQDMATNGYFAHIGPGGQSWYTALAAVGWTMSGGGENLAKVPGDESTAVAVAVERLMASPTHRANIVSQQFRLVGVGAVVDATGLTLFTTIFTDR